MVNGGFSAFLPLSNCRDKSAKGFLVKYRKNILTK